MHNLLPHDGPALTVGVVVAAYWWRVVRMAAKQRRRTGRAANFIPVERLGRVLRMVWQPIVVGWIALPLAVAWLRRPPAGLGLAYDVPAIRWIGAAAVVIGYGLTRVCWRRMGRSWRMGIDPGERTTLVVTGPYAAVRHPIYALSSGMMLATVAAVPTIAMGVVAVVHLLLLQWEARREEHHLSGVHGPAYDDYRAGTGRFVPRVGRGRPAPAPTP